MIPKSTRSHVNIFRFSSLIWNNSMNPKPLSKTMPKSSPNPRTSNRFSPQTEPVLPPSIPFLTFLKEPTSLYLSSSFSFFISSFLSFSISFSFSRPGVGRCVNFCRRQLLVLAMRRWLGIGFLHGAPIKVGKPFLPNCAFEIRPCNQGHGNPISNAKKKGTDGFWEV